MSNSRIFWKLFMQTGAIGLYLLYRYCEDQSVSFCEEKPETIMGEVASERG